MLGLAEKESVGNGAVTVTLIESLAVPPGPLQDRLKLLFVVIAPIVREPDVALLPDQPPDAVQSLARLLVQLIVVEPFIGTVAGLADNEIVGGLRPLPELFALSFIFLAASAAPPVRYKIKLRQRIVFVALKFAILLFLANINRPNRPSITRTVLCG